MKKTWLLRLLVVGLLFLLPVGSSFADDGGARLGFQMNMASSLYQNWLNPSVGFDYMLNSWLGVGGEGEYFYGLTYKDSYAAVNARGWLGPLFLGVGISKKLTNAQPAGDVTSFAYGNEEDSPGFEDLIPMLTTGIRLNVFQGENLTLGLNTGFDLLITDIPINLTEADNLAEALILGIAQALAGVTVGSFKLTAGVSCYF